MVLLNVRDIRKFWFSSFLSVQMELAHSNKSHNDGPASKYPFSKGSLLRYTSLKQQSCLKLKADRTRQMSDSRLTNKEISLRILVLILTLPDCITFSCTLKRKKCFEKEKPWRDGLACQPPKEYFEGFGFCFVFLEKL